MGKNNEFCFVFFFLIEDMFHGNLGPEEIKCS